MTIGNKEPKEQTRSEREVSKLEDGHQPNRDPRQVRNKRIAHLVLMF